MFLIILATLAVQAAAADAQKVTLSIAQPVVEVDAGKLKGDLARLAWSPDGSEFYIQTVERDKSFAVRATRHYVVST